MWLGSISRNDALDQESKRPADEISGPLRSILSRQENDDVLLDESPASARRKRSSI